MNQHVLRNIPYFNYGLDSSKVKHGRKGDAGYDTYNNSGKDITIQPHCTETIELGFGLKLPEGYALFQSSRSGHQKSSVDVAFIPVDSNYTGQIMAITTNNSSEVITIKSGERFAQFVVLAVHDLEFVDANPEDYKTERGDKGFNSSGRF